MKPRDVAKMIAAAHLFLAYAKVCQAESFRPLFDAIRQVETGGHPDPVNALGDSGRSLGPYQITRAYWHDAGTPGRYEQVRNRVYAERVMHDYWQRFKPRALVTNNWRALAQSHNPRSRSYWSKVRKVLR